MDGENSSLTDAIAPDLADADELERRLGTRTRPSEAGLRELRGCSEEQVRDEVRTVTRLLRRLAETVARSIDRAQAFDDVLAELDLRSISRDHDWRSIFAEIRDHHAGEALALKRVVFLKYLQYLSCRKRLLDRIYAEKAGLGVTNELPDLDAAQPAEEAQGGAWRGAPSGFERVPLGERLEVTLAPEEVLEIVLGPNMFELVGGPHPYLVDENGVTCFVKSGRNVVGRHPESDVTVDANFRHVSRAHLILEWDGRHRYALLDLSSRGTWLRQERLSQALDAPVVDAV